MTKRTLEFLSSRRVAGFTLVELVVVIMIMGILAGIVTTFMIHSVEGYRDLARRTALVDAAESALRRMQRDIRIALPNSVRKTDLGGGGFVLETLPTLSGGKFVDRAGGVTNCIRLRINDPTETSFDIIGGFPSVSAGIYNNYRLVVNNLGTTVSTDAYRATGSPAVITPLATTISITRPSACAGSPLTNDHVDLSAGHQFGNAAVTNQRIYIVTTPVTYLCTPNASDPASGTLIRYEAYAITASQPTDPAAAPLATAASALIVGRVNACSVTTTAADIRGRSLVTLTLGLAEEGEQIQLIDQTQLNNSR